MSNVKRNIGEKIKSARLQQNLTREVVCNDESEITIRQLARIESGESLPTLPKLRFLAKKLNISISYLIDDNSLENPKEYSVLKNKIFKQTIYNNNRIEIINSYFDQIYEKFYDILSEEEQLVIDIMHATVNILLSDNIQFASGILKEYFGQTLLKKELAEIDFLLIHLYFVYILEKDVLLEETKTILEVVNKLIDNSNFSNNYHAYLTIQVQISALCILGELNEYKLYKFLLDTIKIVSKENQEFQKLPIIQMMEAKYFLFHENNIEKAKEAYEKSAQTALLLGDDFLKDSILSEFKQDLIKLGC
ncbi:helix-turn-helix domain-containing protein [Vagococcus lutrae]|uniref:helix-turn-helix domain-containing protein n=1 Tax=Vagococcus lutrae TaxID=81947 RepID=UPI002097D178|nr:XRE family transcriptional regulator [Vagococcus lutrae]MCO7151336.1 helix-turn-helix domain-containing protein [Vagococcus lutrae]MDT2813021.1 helix-turn-helix domain-containing protein [Vagococcus lutrae]MDT2820033.1 helix-turn-helix domain-containing protein [Vagococcus lutrae]MDT2844975.1 helix-turn-helix domain-containing protein [Vagococcus lutrae]WCG05816.1 helix-turn-helix domain-containing protein [Vagococcus lutrae]